MTSDEYIYSSLCVLFSVFIITGNLIYQKFVFLSIFPFYTFELSVGAILYPLTFLLTDVIAEFYGKERANFCVKLGIGMNIVVACIIAGMDQLEATNWSKVDNITFHKVFGLYGVAFISSIVACYTAQLVDIKLYLWIRKITQGKWLWVRNNGSTAVSLLIDTVIVITFMTIFYIIPVEQLWPLIMNSYLYKLFFSICSTPLFYMLVFIINNFQQNKRHQSSSFDSYSTH